MKKLILFVAIVALLLTVSSASLMAQSQGGENFIRITGADSMAPRVTALVRLFKKVEPAVTIEVISGGKVDSGILAVINGDADLAMASCGIPEEEDNLALAKGLKLVDRLIGYGGIAIIVNMSSRVKSLTLDEIKKIFKGQITNWKNVGGNDRPIKVIRTGSNYPGTLIFLENDFMEAPFTSRATEVSNFSEVVDSVARTMGGIGYVRIREITESPVVKNNPLVSVIPIGRSKSTIPVYPSRDAVSDHSYRFYDPTMWFI